MPIYLVQHGLSLPKEQAPDPGLSEKGAADTRRIAGVAKGYNVHVDVIYHSGKRRALETAKIFAEFLNPQKGLQPMAGIDPLDDVKVFAVQLEGLGNAMFVGHLPFMSRLTAFLITGQTEGPVFKFQNSGIVCLAKEPEAGNWVICWTLMPNIG